MHRLVYCFLFMFLCCAAQATQTLEQQRLENMKTYVALLGKGDYDGITKLFTEDGTVVSSSGIAETSSKFYKKLFTDTINHPSAQLPQLFSSRNNSEVLIASFYFNWQNKKQQPVGAHFIDLFYFAKDSAKFKKVMVFSNTFKSDVMKQLESV